MPTIRHEVIIGVPAENIYNAITSQEGLAGWWTPGTTARPELGGIARFAFGPVYFKEMKIVDLQPSRLVKWTCITGTEEWLGTNIYFELQPGDRKMLLDLYPEVQDQVQQQSREEATLLIFYHDDWNAYTPMFAECNYTWAQFLRSLKLFCETGKGRPWPHQHRSEL